MHRVQHSYEALPPGIFGASLGVGGMPSLKPSGAVAASQPNFLAEYNATTGSLERQNQNQQTKE